MNRTEFFKAVSDRPTVELARIQLAYWLAKNAHRPFKRENGDRYFEHPRAVAISLIAHGFKGTEYVVLGLLHDVIEDTNTPVPVIADLFGPETWRSLETLSRYMPSFDPLTGQIIGRYKKPQDQYFNEIGAAPARVRTVKCGDRLHNLKTCHRWDDERRARYIDETERFVIPLAHGTAYEDDIKSALEEVRALPIKAPE